MTLYLLPRLREVDQLSLHLLTQRPSIADFIKHRLDLHPELAAFLIRKVTEDKVPEVSDEGALPDALRDVIPAVPRRPATLNTLWHNVTFGSMADEDGGGVHQMRISLARP